MLFLHTPRRSHLQPRFADAARTPAGGGAGTPSGPLRTGQDFSFRRSSARRITAAPACELLKKRHDGPRLDERGTGGGIYLRRSGGRVSDVVFSRTVRCKICLCRRKCARWGRLVHTSDFAEMKRPRGVARVRRETDALLASLGYVQTALAACTSRSALTSDGSRCSRIRASEWPSSAACWTFPIRCSAAISTSIIRGMTSLNFPETPGETVPCVLQLSNDAHLYGDGLPVKYQNRIYI